MCLIEYFARAHACVLGWDFFLCTDHSMSDIVCLSWQSLVTSFNQKWLMHDVTETITSDLFVRVWTLTTSTTTLCAYLLEINRHKTTMKIIIHTQKKKKNKTENRLTVHIFVSLAIFVMNHVRMLFILKCNPLL